MQSLTSTNPEGPLNFNERLALDRQSDRRDPAADSPLWMATQKPALNELVMYLQDFRQSLDQAPLDQHQFQYSRLKLEQARLDFADMIRSGESRLHRLSQLICTRFVSNYLLRSVIIGEVDQTGKRFTLTQDISLEELLSTIDIDLGTQQLKRLRFQVGPNQWSTASLVANVIDYQPTEPNEYRIHRITSRIKAEEEIWNKVVDEIFGLDGIVGRDKELRRYSRFVKDIFGIKIVVGEEDDAHRVQQALQALRWDATSLARLGIEATESTARLEFIEVKDYLSAYRKQSGWEAIKSVVHWSNKTFEIQIQPLRNFLRERELLTKESHTSFKANRERARERVAERLPLFKFYCDLLRWFFLTPHAAPPVYPSVTLYIYD